MIFAEEAKRAGFSVIVVAHRGETDAAIETFADEVTWVYVGQLGKIIRVFEKLGVSEAVMAGGIRKVKLFGNFRPDLRGARREVDRRPQRPGRGGAYGEAEGGGAISDIG